MEDYDRLKSIMKAVSPDIIETFRFCLKCGEKVSYDEIRKIFFCYLLTEAKAVPASDCLGFLRRATTTGSPVETFQLLGNSSDFRQNCRL